jgi:RNA 3'-terminal phosphate cyclase-like protein
MCKGTEITYKPGIIIGGTFTHDCGKSRAIGYFLEGLICLAPFAKKSVHATLNGITNSIEDVSVDILRTVTLPLLKNFGIEQDLELKVF